MVLLFSTLATSCAPTSNVVSSTRELPSAYTSYYELYESPVDRRISSSPCPTTTGPCNDLSLQRSLPSEPIQFRFLNAFGLEMETDEDDYYSDSTSDDHSSGSLSSQISTTSIDSIENALLAERVAEIERRREMLDLSITKIQTINTSHVPVSLRKSVLIYNTMKSLQRDLNDYDNGVYGSLMDEDTVVADLEMDVVDERNTVSAFPQQQQQQDVNNFEMNVDEEPAKAVETARGSPWGQFHNDIANKEDNNSSRQHQQWPWNMETAVAHEMVRSLELLGNNGIGATCASAAGRTATTLIDESTSAPEQQYYNPMTYNNLAQCDWLHMFGMPTANALLSQA